MAGVTARRRGSGWEYRFEMATVGGKRKQYSKSGFRTKKEAMEEGNKAFARYNKAGIVVESAVMSLADHAEFWYSSYCLKNLKRGTCTLYRKVLDELILPRLGQYRMSAITPALVAGWLGQLMDEGYSQSSIKTYKSVLQGCLGYAVQPLGLIDYNPASGSKVPAMAKPSKPRSVVTPDQFSLIVSLLPAGSPYLLPLYIGWYTGLRINEVLALCWCDVDLNAGTLSVVRQVLDGVQDTPKTKKSLRTIPIGHDVCRLLQEERKRQAENREAYGSFYSVYKLEDGHVQESHAGDGGKEDLDFICRRENGQRVKESALTHQCTALSLKSGIPFTFHTLRRSHTTLLLEGGAGVKAVQQRLGHNSSSTTLDIYAQSTEKQAENAAKMLDGLAHIYFFRGQNVGKTPKNGPKTHNTKIVNSLDEKNC